MYYNLPRTSHTPNSREQFEQRKVLNTCEYYVYNYNYGYKID